MEDIDEIISSRWIVPVVPDQTILHNYALVIHQGKILDLLPQTDAAKKYQSKQSYHLQEHVLIPGLINSHTHAAMNLLRGYADDKPLMDWLQNYIWPAEQKWVCDEFVADGSRLAAAEMIQSGTTCFNDMYFFPEATARIAQDTGLRATIGLIVIDFPSNWASTTEEYFEKGLQVYDTFGQYPLVNASFAPHAPYTVSDEPLKKIAALSRELNIPVNIHLHETRDEIPQSQQQYGLRPLERLDKIGLVNPSLMAIHMTQLNTNDIALLADKGVHVIHCPESNMKLASGFCPVAELVDAGINITLGTDSVASNNDLDMIGEMRSAALLAKNVSGNAESVPAEYALRMATINAARALGMESTIGSLEIGKQADITAINLNNIATQPVYNPVATIVYSSCAEHVSHVWVNGQILLNNREFCTIDIESTIKKGQIWFDRMNPEKSKPATLV